MVPPRSGGVRPRDPRRRRHSGGERFVLPCPGSSRKSAVDCTFRRTLARAHRGGYVAGVSHAGPSSARPATPTRPVPWVLPPHPLLSPRPPLWVGGSCLGAAVDAAFSSPTSDGRAGVRAAWAGTRRLGGWTGLVDGVPSVCVCQSPPQPPPPARLRGHTRPPQPAAAMEVPSLCKRRRAPIDDALDKVRPSQGPVEVGLLDLPDELLRGIAAQLFFFPSTACFVRISFDAGCSSAGGLLWWATAPWSASPSRPS